MRKVVKRWPESGAAQCIPILRRRTGAHEHPGAANFRGFFPLRPRGTCVPRHCDSAQTALQRYARQPRDRRASRTPSAALRAPLRGPLGVGTVRIEGAGDSVQITGKDGVTTVLRDVEAELYYRYGWTIPVESLRYWVLGIPDPRVPSQTEFDELDRVRHLRQRGWDVEVDRYREAGGQQMPARLVATSNETKVRIIIDRWIFREIVASP